MSQLHAVTTPAELLARARALVPFLSSQAAKADRSGRLERDNFDRLHREGILSLVIGARDGGAGGGLSEAVRAISLVAQGDPSTALIVAMYFNQHGSIAARDPLWPEALAKSLTQEALARVALINAAYVEPFVGSASHGAIPQTVGRRVGKRWVLSGQKKYVTGIPVLSWLRVMGVTDEPDPRVGFFLVPANAPGVSVTESWDTLGMRATSSNDVSFRNVELPEDHFFGGRPLEQGLPIEPRGSIWYLILVGAVYHGIAQAARDAIVAFTLQTKPGALGAPLASLARFQDGIGEIEALQTTARRLLLSVAADHDAADAGTNLTSLLREAEVGRLIAIKNAIEVTSVALDLAGNQGVTRQNDFERFHRDALTARAHHPQSFLIKSNLGHAALGLKRSTPLRSGVKTLARAAS